MATENTTRAIQRYQKTKRRSAVRLKYLKDFVPKMIYRTTKTENPSTSRRMVNAVLKESK